MFQQHKIAWSLGLSTLLWAFLSVQADTLKDSGKDPIKQKELSTDKLLGDQAIPKTKLPAKSTKPLAPTTKPIPATTQPVGVVWDDKSLFLARLRWIMLNRYSQASYHLFLIDLLPLLKKHPNDHTLLYLQAFFSAIDGHPQQMDIFCGSPAVQKFVFYSLYCRAWQNSSVSEYNTLPTATSVRVFNQLVESYQKTPKDQNLRLHLMFHYATNRYSLVDAHYNATIRGLLKEELAEHPHNVWTQASWIAAQVDARLRQHSQLVFLLPEAQALAQKHPNHIIPHMLVWFIAKRLYARSVLEKTGVVLNKLTQEKDLWSQLHRHLYLSAQSDMQAMLTHLTNLIDRPNPDGLAQPHYANMLCRMIMGISWRYRKHVLPLYQALLKRYPNHSCSLLQTAYHLERLGQKAEAQKLYQQAVLVVNDDRSLRELYWKIYYTYRPLAFQLLNRYLQSHPNHVWALSRRAEIHKRSNRKEQAEQDYATLLAQKKGLPSGVYLDIIRHYQYGNNDLLAMKICNTALQKHPNDASLYAARAELHKRLNQPAAATADYLKAFEFQPTSTWYGESYARFLQEQGQTPKALAFLQEQANRKTPQQTRWKKVLIEFLYKAGKGQEAQALAVQTGDAETLLSAGRNMVQQGQYIKAIDMFRAALLKSTNTYNRQSVYREMAETYTKLKQYDQAEQAYLQGIQLAPKYYYSYYSLSRMYLDQMKQPQKALTVWNIYLQKKPADSNAYYQRGEIYKQMKDGVAATMNYMQGFAHSPKARWDYDRVANFLSWSMRRKDLAVSVWSDYLAKKPSDAVAYRNRATLYAQLKQYQEAKADYLKAISLAPHDSYSHSSLANLYQYHLKQPDKALAVWTKFLESHPKNAPAYRNRAHLYRSKKNYPLAIQDMETSLGLEPNNPYAYSPLASLYQYELKDYPKARSVWTRYIALHGHRDMGYVERAKLWSLEKQWKQALADWQAANTRVRGDWRKVEVLKGIGISYRHLQQYELAIQALQHAQRLTSSSYSRRSLGMEIALTHEASGNYKAALQSLDSLPPSSWDVTPHWMKIRFLVGAGLWDQALALAASSCSGPTQMKSAYHRKQACHQYKWLEYQARLFQWPFTAQAFEQPAISPARPASSQKSFKDILQFLLRAKGTSQPNQHKK